MALQHIVLFAFAQDLDDDQARDMREQIEAWPSEIGGIDALRFGMDLTGARTRGHQYLLYMEFAGLAELQAYQQHPVHQRFLAWVLDRNCTPLAFDYHLTAQTVMLPPGAFPGSD